MSENTPSSHDVRQNMDAELDRILLQKLRDGVPARNKQGEIQFDKDGEIIMVPPSAADLNVARQRLKDLGINKVINSDSEAEKLREAVGDAIGRHPDLKMFSDADMPEISDERDAAAG